MIHARKLIAAALVAVFTSAAHAGETNVGAHLQPFSLSDQFDHGHSVDAQTRLILFSRDKDLAKMAFGALGQRDPRYLAERNAVMILDISEMPRIITWAIAKRRMRRHGFPLLLDPGPGPTASLPSKEKALTLVYLKDLVVRDVAYVSDAAALEKALDGLDR